MDRLSLWQRFCRYRCGVETLGLSLDISRMGFDEGFFAKTAGATEQAFRAMDALEAGAVANKDEERRVGHYWLRAPRRAPSAELTGEIEVVLHDVRRFAAEVHEGRIRPPSGRRFERVLLIGIGGSALGPMLVSDALGDPATDRMQIGFVDNTDPDGIDRTLRAIGKDLDQTLCLIVSKSGGTAETRNGQLLVQAAYQRADLDFAAHAVAVTLPGSRLDKLARSEKWLARFPMFDWVGGRTSEFSAVGLLPAALQGLDIDGMLEGAAICDEATRSHDTLRNPAAVMALMWLHATGGRGEKDLVILPYKDRLSLMSRYLQQLVMESLGKRLDRSGRRVEQGITVYGNKGSTDQHAYIQQLRDGVANFFVTFIRVLDSGGDPLQVEPQVSAGDFLHGFLLGTREALFENDRYSMTITLPAVTARTVGGLIALFERAVGLYAELIDINAYHQPGVEAGKKAASTVLNLQRHIARQLSDQPATAAEIAAALGAEEQVETVYLLLEHLAFNGQAEIISDQDPRLAAFRKPPGPEPTATVKSR